MATTHRMQDRRTALVTGAASGIGRSCAVAFADAGYRVVLADVAVESGRTVEAEILRTGGSARFVTASVADPDAVGALFDTIVAHEGTLDVAANCAGIEQPRGRIVDTDMEDWDRVIDVDLRGVWLSLKHELRQMYRQGYGAIVNVSSMVAHRAANGAAAYVAAKHGILGLTRAAALESAEYGVRVNSVSPGHIRTPMVDRVLEREPEVELRYLARTPLARLGDSDEVARAVLWLCSDAASFVTGSDLGVDGGVLLA